MGGPGTGIEEELEEKDPQFAYTLARGLDVLRAFDVEHAQLGNRDLAARTGIPRPTVARLTRTLAMLGYLRYDQPTARYRLTVSMLTLAHPVLAQLAVRRIARPLMQQLADHAHGAVSMGARHGLDMVLVESCIDNNSITARPDIGATRPILSTAIGRAHLAALDEAPRRQLLAELRAADPAAWKRFRAEVEQAVEDFARNGYCVALDTSRKGMHAAGVALRNSGGEVLALNCVVAAFQLGPDTLEKDLVPRLINLAQSVEMALGRS